MLSLAEALERLPDWVPPLQGEETLPAGEADGRILAQDVLATGPQPAFSHSAMDGFAVRSEDLNGQALRLRETVLAGAGIPSDLAAGECVQVMTGAAVPLNADQVVMQEQAHLQDQAVTLAAAAQSGQYLRRRGEDLAAGDTVLQAGQRLGPAQLGMLAALGVTTVACRPQARVALLSTGDELLEAGQPLQPGQRPDANRSLLASLLRRDGSRVIDCGIVPDQPQAIRQALDRAASESDLVISSGGVSAGQADYLPGLLGESGQVGFWKLRLRPGMPLLLGRWKDTTVFGLPGNPVSALNTCLRIVRPALALMTGTPHRPANCFQASLAHELQRKPGREEFARGQLAGGPGNWQVRLLPNQSSGRLLSLLEGDCFVHLPADCEALPAGHPVTVEPFAWPLERGL